MKIQLYTLIFILASSSVFSHENCSSLPSLIGQQITSTEENNEESNQELPSINIEEIENMEELLGSNQNILARSGGWSGNGGDFSEVNDNIWFLGEEDINYCINSSNDFTLDKHTLSKLITKSINNWKSFFEKYNLLGPLAKENIGRRQISVQFPDGKNRSINFNFKEVRDCKNAKLSFFFGKENKHISDYKKFATEHPYGFALRKSYDHKSFMNTGLIWIKNNQDQNIIEHTLLHELGHILGMKHDSVYIMRTSMAQDLEEIKFTNSIETQAWPYRFSEGSSIFLEVSKRRKKSKRFCSGENQFVSVRNHQIFNQLIKTKPFDCLSIKVSSVGNPSIRGLNLNLEITNHSTGKSKILKGQFSNKRKTLKKKKGPGVFTQYLIKKPNKSILAWRKVSLDNADHNELSGSFKFKRMHLPAKLTQEKGAIIDLFLPFNNKWLTLRSYK